MVMLTKIAVDSASEVFIADQPKLFHGWVIYEIFNDLEKFFRGFHEWEVTGILDLDDLRIGDVLMDNIHRFGEVAIMIGSYDKCRAHDRLQRIGDIEFREIAIETAQ